MTEAPSPKSTMPAAPAKATPRPPTPKGTDGLARGISLLALLVACGALALSPLSPLAPRPADQTPQRLAVQNQLATLAQDIAQLKAAPPAPATPPTIAVMPDPAMAVRTAAPVADNAMTEQLHNALTEIATLRDKLNNLQNSVAGAEEVKQQLTQLKNDLAVANTAISGMRGHVQQVTENAQQVAAAETATRTEIIAYMELRNAAAQALPFEGALTNLCGLAKANAAITGECAKLEKAAQSGVATVAMLQSRFAVMSPPAERAVAMAEAKGWMDRLKVSFDEVVQIRRTDGSDTTNTPKLILEASAALQRGNLAEAVAKVTSLPEVAQKELQEWMTDAQARLALDAVLLRIGTGLGQIATTTAAPIPTATTGNAP